MLIGENCEEIQLTVSCMITDRRSADECVSYGERARSSRRHLASGDLRPPAGSVNFYKLWWYVRLKWIVSVHSLWLTDYFWCSLWVWCLYTSTWLRLKCDVGLEEGILTELSLCCSVVYHCNGAQLYVQFLQVGRLYWSLILLDLALCLPGTSVSLVFVVLYRY